MGEWGFRLGEREKKASGLGGTPSGVEGHPWSYRKVSWVLAYLFGDCVADALDPLRFDCLPVEGW